MRLRFFRGAVVGVLALIGASAAAAPPRPSTGSGQARDASIQLPNPEKIRRTAVALAEMRQHLREVAIKLEEARHSKDVVKLNCVNEKLTQMKKLHRLADQASTELSAAVARSAPGTPEREYAKIVVARRKVEHLKEAEEGCVGQLAFRMDERQTVEVIEPQDQGPDDKTMAPRAPNVVVRPPPASPTRPSP
jgi:hypothetical protein